MRTIREWGPIQGPLSRPKDHVQTTGIDGGYTTLETTQRYVYGARWITVDGRVFKYGHALSALLSGYGAPNAAAQNIAAVPPVAMAVGDNVVKVTIAAGDGHAGDGVIAENELEGGYFVTGHDEVAAVQNRLILENTAVASGGGTTLLTLDAPIANAIAVTSYNEIVLNPYRYLTRTGGDEYMAFMCVPAVNVSTGYNFWGQTWGPCWVVPGGGDTTPGNTANDREAFFVGDGSVNFGTALTLETGYQKAGFCIDNTAGPVSALPLIMLQLSI
jgi:hypothetical protein